MEAIKKVKVVDAVPRPHFFLRVVSPGSEDGELKDQDRAVLLTLKEGDREQKQVAIVCDGLSQSPNSAEAAEHVSVNVERLYEENGVRQVADELLEKRERLIETPLKLDHIESQVLRTMFADILKGKRALSYQTTFISVCLERDDPSRGQLRVRVLGCGDSGLFVFSDDGKLLYNNLCLDGEDDLFEHVSPITKALPDSFDEADSVLSHSQEFPEGAHILLCTDGLFDSFNTFSELFAWLTSNRTKLAQKAGEEELMAELHSSLRGRKGDDDISFIWLSPADGLTPAGAEESCLRAREGDVPRRRRGLKSFCSKPRFLRKLLDLLRRVGLIRSEESGDQAYERSR